MGHQPLNQQAIAIIVFDIDGVVRDVGNSYRRALADTVEQFTDGAYRPSQADIDALKTEGVWNNDWEASEEMVYRYFETQGRSRTEINLSYTDLVDFFQRRYRGSNLDHPDQWDGYICQEPLLLEPTYLQGLTQAGMPWGFFSGATRGSAAYVLERRLGLKAPVLVAMEDAPGKPDPTGLLAAVQQLTTQQTLPPALPVVYVGDTVADMQTVQMASQQDQTRTWVGIGILPPHAQAPLDYAIAYSNTLNHAGAVDVLKNVQELTPEAVRHLVKELKA